MFSLFLVLSFFFPHQSLSLCFFYLSLQFYFSTSFFSFLQLFFFLSFLKLSNLVLNSYNRSTLIWSTTGPPRRRCWKPGWPLTARTCSSSIPSLRLPTVKADSEPKQGEQYFIFSLVQFIIVLKSIKSNSPISLYDPSVSFFYKLERSLSYC